VHTISFDPCAQTQPASEVPRHTQDCSSSVSVKEIMELLSPYPLFFDREHDSARERKLQDIVDEVSDPERRLLCATCKHPVTQHDQRITVQGGHEHRFTNPHGITYQIGCFRKASGCAVLGDATTEFTWFRGFAWRIAICANCQAHLGWRFESASEYFHGLIVDRLISAGTT
jgi:hypothetical protein